MNVVVLLRRGQEAPERVVGKGGGLVERVRAREQQAPAVVGERRDLAIGIRDRERIAHCLKKRLPTPIPPNPFSSFQPHFLRP